MYSGPRDREQGAELRRWQWKWRGQIGNSRDSLVERVVPGVQFIMAVEKGRGKTPGRLQY